jgi:antitoxin (DNA-binding transcriptional repressor) of toxin-antitoxin stability system
MTVGTKELKNRLSHYLRRVGDGEIVRVTDRGKVIAELRAVAVPAVDDERLLADLENDGVVTRGSGRFAAFRGVRLDGRVRASRAILADRR